MEAMLHVKSARAALHPRMRQSLAIANSLIFGPDRHPSLGRAVPPTPGPRPDRPAGESGHIDINVLPSPGRLGHLLAFPVQQISSTMWGGMAGSAQQAGHYGPAGGGGKFRALARLASRNFQSGGCVGSMKNVMISRIALPDIPSYDVFLLI